MNEMRVILLCIGILIIIINFFINFSNLFKIVVFCFQTGSVSQYWKLFFKTSVNGRAIISSIIGFVLALIIFFLILPFVLLKSGTAKKINNDLIDNGNVFVYQDIDLKENNLLFNSNINYLLDIDLSSFKVTGKIRVDALMWMSEIEEKCKEENKSVNFEIMYKLNLVNNSEAIIPLLLILEDKKIPIYFIYTVEQKKQYRNIKSLLFDSGYKQCIYFSIIPM